MGTSLWLVPSATVAARLRYVMSLLPPSTSPSSLATFAPHITLATVPSSTPTPTIVSALPPALTPVPVRFRSVDVGAKYFMSVYARVHEDAVLGALRAHLRVVLGEHAVPETPHLSLYYIDDADAEVRTRIGELLHSTGRVVKREEGITLNCVPTDAGEALPEGRNDPGLQLLEGFEGTEVWVVRCEGHPHHWKVLQKIFLPHT